MRCLLPLACAAFACVLPASAADLVITQTETTEGAKVAGVQRAAKETTEVLWFGKDRLRSEVGSRVTIVRADLKELFLVDTRARTFSRVELPIVIEKHLPAAVAEVLVPTISQTKLSVVPTTETKTINGWSTTRYTLTLTTSAGATTKEELWVTKDVPAEFATLQELRAAQLSASMFGVSPAAELKKLDGIAVLVEKSGSAMGVETKSRTEVRAIEKKEPPEGLYDVPKDFKEVPFDPLSDGSNRGPGAVPKSGESESKDKPAPRGG